METESLGGCTLASLFTPRIIQRSFPLPSNLLITDQIRRALLANIRDMGGCPCPRCLVTNDELSGLGTANDAQFCTERLRIDSRALCFDINAARRLIYQAGYAVNGDAVNGVMNEKSYVPTMVCANVCENVFDLLHRMPFGPSQRTAFSIFFSSRCLIIMHKFELGAGNLSLRTFCAFCVQSVAIL